MTISFVIHMAKFYSRFLHLILLMIFNYKMEMRFSFSISCQYERKMPQLNIQSIIHSVP